MRFRFWSTQPVFHFHNIWFWIFPPGIIQHEHPIKPNKFVNQYNVAVKKFDDISSLQLDAICVLIRNHYLVERDMSYTPSKSNIVSYFKSHNGPCYVALYETRTALKDTKNSCYIPSKTMVGALTSRPVTVCLFQKNTFVSQYVDYLCVKKQNRQNGIAPQLIATYADSVRKMDSNVTTFMFKREGESTAIVPIVVYKSYTYNTQYWTSNVQFPHPYCITFITKGNVKLLIRTLEMQCIRKLFDCVLLSSIGNITHLIETGILLPYVIHNGDDVVAIYFYRDGCVRYKKGVVIELVCSVLLDDAFAEFFELGLFHSVVELKKTHQLAHLTIENLSHNNQLIQHINKSFNPEYEVPYSYYFYNFAHRPFLNQEVFVLT